MKTLGIDARLEMPQAKSSFRPHKPYQDYYDERTKTLVGDWYQNEIKLLGYSFR